MNPNEQEIAYPLQTRRPEPGGSIELAPGVRWIRMALPFALDHINLWLLADEVDGRAGWTVVDTCICRDESKAQWEQVLAHELQGAPVLRVVCTHMHPDHLGLAHWLCERFDCPLYISATDFHLARLLSAGVGGFGAQRSVDFFASHGLRDAEQLGQVHRRTSSYFPSLVPALPAAFVRLMDGGVLHIGGHDWHCIAGYGHAPEHISLHCPALNVLISGDMLLPRISTNVSVHDVEPDANPLQMFLDSIERYAPLPAHTLVLPSHGLPFGGSAASDGHGGIHTRLAQLRQHHDDRLAEAMQACTRQPTCAAELLTVLFKRALDSHQTTFAMGEAVAHLHALWAPGLVARQRDALGVWRFAAT